MRKKEEPEKGSIGSSDGRGCGTATTRNKRKVSLRKKEA